MPALSFSCITRLRQSSQIVRRRTSIKGHDFRTLALAAAEQLQAPSDQCTYAIARQRGEHPHVMLEVQHGDDEAFVGPMSGPIPPPRVAADVLNRRYGLRELLARLECDGLEDDNVPNDSRQDDAIKRRRYLVTVAYRSLRESAMYPPAREPRESDRQYRTRCQEAERIRIDRTRHQGFHIASYDVSPRDWTSDDIEMMLGLAYRFLPASEPRWRESGTITQARFAAAEGDTRRVTIGYCLEVVRGEYVAYVRLPMFPTLALAEWLADRRCDISLRHPIMKLELLARGWRRRVSTEPGLTRDALAAHAATD